MATSNSFGKSSFSEASVAADTEPRSASGSEPRSASGTEQRSASGTEQRSASGTEQRAASRLDTDIALGQELSQTFSTPKHAEQVYRSAATVRASGASPEPWEDLDSGRVLWGDFTPAEQESIARYYAPKVKYLAVRLKARLPRNVDLNELISAGSMGLVESFSKFKPDMGVKFNTYAENRIRGAMLDELRRMDWFPRSLRQKVRQIDSAILQSEQTTGRMPNESELAALTGLSEKEVREGLEALQNQIFFSLDALENILSGDEGGGSGEPFAETATKEMIAKVADLIEQLTPREKLVLSLYYTDELNMREAAEVMGITEGRVSQLHSQALGRLRKEFNSQHGLYST